MGPISAVTLSGGTITKDVIGIGLLILDYVAVTKIISKAGYSSKWVLVPLAPVFLWLITIVLLLVDTRSVIIGGTVVNLPVSLDNFKILAVLDFLSVIVTWVFFLIFAFSEWPVSTRRREPSRPFTNQPADFAYAAPRQQNPGPAPAVAGAPPMMAAGAVATSVAPVASPAMPGPAETAPTQSDTSPQVIFCSWCGKERAVNAQAIHYCGSMERPPVYCMHCGTPFKDGAANCGSCGTPVTKVSR